MAVAGRYIRSNLKVGTDNGDMQQNFAIDIAGFTNQKKLHTMNLMVDGELVSTFKT
jgi:hypothetical protein